jgi:hypothetical protein
MPARIVPIAYILSDEAIEELVGADPHHRRLKEIWSAATGEAKAKAYIEVCERQNQLTDRLFEAVKSGKLLAIALKRMPPSGEWVEHRIAARYLETLGGDLAFWTGSVERLGLEPADRWMADAPLCYRREDFDDWLASTIVVRPLGCEDLPTWWTVPEAAVWIVTRDPSKVRLLDAKARAWLFVAAEVVPGAWEASFELLAGLRKGRLLASGWYRGRQPHGVGERIQPEFWQPPTEFSDGKTGVEALRGPGDAIVGLLLESDDVMSRWESPQSLLDGNKIALGEAIGRLMHENLPKYLLNHPEVCVTGLNSRGERVEIDKDVFQTNATIDRRNHAVTTADDRLHWSAVMVELRAKAEPETTEPTEDEGKRYMDGTAAARRVHRALCGEETIVGLTSRERWLLNMDYFEAWDRGLSDEWQEAINKEELWQHQCQEALSWLKERGLVVESNSGNGDRVEGPKFEEAFRAAFPAPAGPIRSTLVQKPGRGKSEQPTPHELELREWSEKLCRAVRRAGKRIAKGPFTSLAWARFGTGSGLTTDGIAAAWTRARESVGWPASGAIPSALQIDDVDLRKLANETGLLGQASKPS